MQAQAQLATTSLPYPFSELWFDLLLLAFLVRELRRCRKNGCGHNARLPLRRIGTAGIEREKIMKLFYAPAACSLAPHIAAREPGSILR